MNSNYLPAVSLKALEDAQKAEDDDLLYDLFAQPLHEELYRKKTFDFLDDLSDGQQLFIAYDYARMQVGQGGFIQFIQNGYVGLLPSMVEQMYKLGIGYMAHILDDVLKVYVLNRELFEKSTSVEDFARLYDELKEFEVIDGRYAKLNEATIKKMLTYAMSHLGEFITPV